MQINPTDSLLVKSRPTPSLSLVVASFFSLSDEHDEKRKICLSVSLARASSSGNGIYLMKNKLVLSNQFTQAK